MKPVYINSLASISAQKTFDNKQFLDEIIDFEDTVISASSPNYKEYLPAAAARRMAKGVKMGIVASKIALQEAHLEQVDAIITGTGMGCLRDSEKFLSNLIDNDEQYLTPTSFIQSTHNTVGGQIALNLNCKGYNFTYVHGSVSFESALLDAKLQLENEEAQNILIGGVDEIGDHTVSIHKLNGHIKKESIPSNQILNATTSGAIFSEGASFFVISNQKQENTYAKVLDVKMFNTLLVSDLEQELTSFLKENQFSKNDIDVIILGNNGDKEFDYFYNKFSEDFFYNTQQVVYKHIVGEYHTVSSFGFWLGLKMIKKQTIPEIIKFNSVNTKTYKTVLLYNQYRGKNHSFTLLQGC